MATIIVGTNSYVTVAELETYASDRGITITASDKTVLLIKAMDYIETRNYISYKTVSTQALEFPRYLCSMYSYDCEYDNDEVPDDIKKAQIVAALLIDEGNELQATTTQTVKREKVDVLEVEYMDNSSQANSYTSLNDLLNPFLAYAGLRGVRI